MQIVSFAFLSPVLIITQLGSALNSLYSHIAKSFCCFVWDMGIADCLQNINIPSFAFFTLNLFYLNAHYCHQYVVSLIENIELQYSDFLRVMCN